MSTANTSAIHSASGESSYATDSAGVASTHRSFMDVNAMICNSLTFDAVSSRDIRESSSNTTRERLSSDVNLIRTGSRRTRLEDEESKVERNRKTRNADKVQRQRMRRTQVNQRQLVVSGHPEHYIYTINWRHISLDTARKTNGFECKRTKYA